MKKNNKGFTLVEIVIAVAILAILIGIAVPALLGNVNKSKIATDKSNAATIGQTAMLVITEADGSTVYKNVDKTLTAVATNPTSGSFEEAFVNKLGNAADIKPKVSGYTDFQLVVSDITSDSADVKVYAVKGSDKVQLWPEVAATANYGKKTSESK